MSLFCAPQVLLDVKFRKPGLYWQGRGNCLNLCAGWLWNWSYRIEHFFLVVASAFPSCCRFRRCVYSVQGLKASQTLSWNTWRRGDPWWRPTLEGRERRSPRAKLATWLRLEIMGPWRPAL